MKMKKEDKVFRELFNNTDSILIIDINGKVLYYDDFNDQINMIRYENAVGRSIYDLYPFFKREDFTVFKAIDQKSVIVNELQSFEVNGVQKKALNSAYPLINETGVIGCMVMSVELNSENVQKRRGNFSARYNFEDIITQDKKFLASFEVLRRLASSDSGVLIYGETGTGKELIAHTIHNNSPRKRKPFIIQNCAAIPDNLMESTLFGSVKGSFTGAIDRAGLFEVADGGTLYFDEINSLSPDLQAKLLRVIENKSIRRVGDTVERDVDVRIIASTNENLAAMVENNTFRKDLFYRLNVASYSIMPLRERTGDIPLVCDHYIRIYNARLNHLIEGIDSEAAEFMRTYPWEGNVRELKNVIEYVCTVKTKGMVTIHDLPRYMFSKRHSDVSSTDHAARRNQPAAAGQPTRNQSITSSDWSSVHDQSITSSDWSSAHNQNAASSGLPQQKNESTESRQHQQHESAAPPYQQSESSGTEVASYIMPGQSLESQLDALEKEIIGRTIRRSRYNISKTAAELKVSRQTLYNKLKKYDLM